MNIQYTDAQLYNQLRFFAFLFDCQKAQQHCQKLPKLRALRKHVVAEKGVLIICLGDNVEAIIAKNQRLLEDLANCVEKHLNNCGRRWIDLGSIFATMKL